MCNFLLINSNLGPISHFLATIARNDLQGHPRSIISILTKTAYAITISD